MGKHEKKAFLKFFITYFISVALLILAAGFFYYLQMKEVLLKSQEFSMIEYARHIKFHENIREYKNGIYSHKFVHTKQKHIDIRNFYTLDNLFMKYIPTKKPGYYMQVFKKKDDFNHQLSRLQYKIILFQFLLLLIFAYISYKLAKNALKPLQESISTLDRFAKDLIHDLNTPVTAIGLNMKILAKDSACRKNSAVKRIEKSVETISQLHKNLTVLLQEETFQLAPLPLCKIVKELVQTQKQLCPHIHFEYECNHSFVADLNEHAIKQILQNLLANACKYNKKDGFVKIFSQNNALYIQNSGPKIDNPKEIFKRSYSGDRNGSGIGLDIVKRLALAMNIEIEVKSIDGVNTFILTMP